MSNSNTIVKPTVLDPCTAKHGLSISTLLADEVDALLLSSIGKRLSPLTIVTTTAGYDRGAHLLYDYALKVV